MTHPRTYKLKSKLLPWLGGLLIIVVLGALWKPLSHVGADSTAVRTWIEPLGPFAPLAYFVLNVAQIVVAPIPGYPVQVLGGLLFGVVPGSLYAVGGMVAGGTLAAWLARRFGRPWLERRMGAETLDQWSKIAHIDSFWTWWAILLIPLGDIPYFLAGLSRVPLSRFALAILTSRGPFTVLVVWAGDSVVNLPLVWVALLMAVIGLIIIVGFSQHERIEAWGRAYIARRATETEKP
ncbi:MAG: TVP38/TMEM64 family protein [Anaerolineae bacterium]|nr:TVP38/TMEM64 family protein [Anaerolineae bacterium]